MRILLAAALVVVGIGSASAQKISQFPSTPGNAASPDDQVLTVSSLCAQGNCRTSVAQILAAANPAANITGGTIAGITSLGVTGNATVTGNLTVTGTIIGAGAACTTNCTFTGTTTTAGITDSGGINTISRYSVSGSEVINLFANEVSPILPNSALNTVKADASYTPRPMVFGYTTTIGAATQNTYAGSLTDNLTISGTMANHWGEGINALNILAGSGTITGELNILNNSLLIGAGNTVGRGGTTEGQIANNGTVNGSLRSFYTSNVNGATGTFAASTGIMYGFDDIWTNNNTTAGSLWQHVGHHCNAMAGAGSTPTFNYCLRNDDTLGLISTLGAVSIGSNAAPGAGVQLKILGPDALSTSFPLQVSGNTIANILLVRDSGEVDMNGALLALGVNATRSAVLQVQSATAGNSAQVQGGTAAGAFYQILGTQITGTPSTFACWQSNGILIFNAGMCAAVPSIQFNAPVTVATLPTCNTASRGTTQMVSDANSPAYNATLAGSGAAFVKAFCNGTNWVGG